jgi:dTDP-4-amino-4,6-dideoxygalactose transaminase
LIKVYGIRPLAKPQNSVHNYYKYVAILDQGVNRDRFKERLKALGVRCGGEVYWPLIHLQPIYQKLLGTRKGDFPMAEDVCSRMVALPIYPQMTMEDAEYVIQRIKEVLSSLR